MQNRRLRQFRGIGLLFGFTLVAFSQTTSFELTGVEGASMAGVYTSPYYATVGGQANVAVICDDYASESYLDESWTVYQTNLSSLVSGNTVVPPKWSSGYSEPTLGNLIAGGLNQATAYTVAAYLATEIVDATPGSQNQEDLSFAMWALFDGGTAFSGLSGSDLTGAEQDLMTAETQVSTLGLTTSSYSDVVIYSYDAAAGLPTGCGGTCPPPPQEFITVMPEPSSPGLLGLDLLGVAGLILLARRRLAHR